MSRRLSLEDFDGPEQVAPVRTEPVPDIDVDALRSAAFEDGYKSGWDDCHAEHLKSEDAVASDLGQSLRDAELSYREARRDVLSAIKPVIDTIISQLLPKLATDGLSATVAQELMPMLQDASELEPELFCAPAMVPVLQSLIGKRDDLTIRLQPEPSFTGAQVALRLGAESRDIDLGEAVEKIAEELAAFTDRLIADLPEQQKG